MVFSFGMQVPRPFPQCTQTIATASGIVGLLCVLCVFVCVSWRPPLSPHGTSGMQQEEWGDERKEGRREERTGRWYRQDRPGRGPRGSCVCVSVHYLLSVLAEKVTSWFALVWGMSALSPQALDCDIIDLGGGKSLERKPLSPHAAAFVRTYTHSHARSSPLTHSGALQGEHEGAGDPG